MVCSRSSKDEGYSDRIKRVRKNQQLESPPDMILIGQLPDQVDVHHIDFSDGIHLYLDQIQDPGNLGTIFRTVEWFGVNSVGMSEGCVDLFHPKVIQASKGSFWRVQHWLGDIPSFTWYTDHWG